MPLCVRQSCFNGYSLGQSVMIQKTFLLSILHYAYMCMKCSKFNSALYGILFVMITYNHVENVMIPYNLIELHHFSCNQSLYILPFDELLCVSLQTSKAYDFSRLYEFNHSLVRGCSHPPYVNQLQ